MLAAFKDRIAAWNMRVEGAEFVEADEKGGPSYKGGSKETAPGKVGPGFAGQLATKTNENLPPS